MTAQSSLMTLDWLWWGSAGALALVGLVLWLWAMFWDRSRGRRRCPKCWYDLKGVKAQRGRGTEAQSVECWRCPECGRLIARERKLFKTRRRWRWAVVACMIGLGGGVGVPWWRAIEQGGFWATLPTWVLIRVVDAQGWPEREDDTLQNGWSSPSRELSNRFWMRDEITDAHRYLIDRSKLRCIRYRSTWPREVPFRLELRSPPLAAIYGNSIRCQLLSEDGTVLVEHEDLARSAFHTGPGPAIVPWRDRTSHLPIEASSGRVFAEFGLTIEASPAQWGEPLHTVYNNRVPIRVTLVESIEDAIEPHTSQQLRAALEERLELTLMWLNTSDGLQWFIGIEDEETPPDETMTTWTFSMTKHRQSMRALAVSMRRAHPDTAFGLRLELMHGQASIATARCWLNPDDFNMRPYEEHTNRVKLIADSQPILKLIESTDDWYIRVSGDGEMALRDFDRERYWSGSFDVPASEIQVEEVADDRW